MEGRQVSHLPLSEGRRPPADGEQDVHLGALRSLGVGDGNLQLLVLLVWNTSGRCAPLV